jgi:hypothetical protein
MSLPSFITLPVLLIGMTAAAASAQTLCPCGGTAANLVCFNRGGTTAVAQNSSDRTVNLVLYDAELRDYPGNTPHIESINVLPGSWAVWPSRLRFGLCMANY